MHKGLKAPHLLLAAPNPNKLISNLSHILLPTELAKITVELDRNVTQLFALGTSHYNFATRLSTRNWRQKVSRLYYGVYNVRRAVALKDEGLFSSDSSDHKAVDHLPDSLPNRAGHSSNLKVLRDDRNLADYSHAATAADLVMTLADAQAFAASFIGDCRIFLRSQGLSL